MKTVPGLQELESRLMAVILGQTGGTEGFGGPVRADAGTGLRVYVEAYSLRLLEALRNDFEGLLRLAGPEEFERIGRAYIAAHPSQNPNLRWYGIGLSHFLRRRDEWRARPDFGDIAAFEWAEGEAFDAADMPAMDADALSAVAPEDWSDLGFLFHPSYRRVELTTDVPGWIERDGEGGGNDAPPARGLPAAWIFWRKDLMILRRKAEPDEAAALAAAHDGLGFEAICRAVAEHIGFEQAPGRAAGLLRVWFDAGMIVGLRKTS